MVGDFNERISVLAILPDPGDRDSLSRIISHSNWMLHLAKTYEEARLGLEEEVPAAIVSDCHLPGGFGWKDVLYLAEAIDNAPPVIVTDRLADERLWAEVLNERGCDVLTKPFDRDEVFRIISYAGRRDRGRRAPNRRSLRSLVVGRTSMQRLGRSYDRPRSAHSAPGIGRRTHL